MAAMFVYVTARDATEAERIGRAVVSERLAACANILAGMRSIYWWEGKIEADAEAVLMLKTTRERLDALVVRIKALHSYDCPCIEAWPIDGGNPAFLAWIERETAGGSP